MASNVPDMLMAGQPFHGSIAKPMASTPTAKAGAPGRAISERQADAAR
jgi:hypothetical protein